MTPDATVRPLTGRTVLICLLAFFGVVIGEVATMQKWLWKGLRFNGGVVAASGAAFLLQTLGAAV